VSRTELLERQDAPRDTKSRTTYAPSCLLPRPVVRWGQFTNSPPRLPLARALDAYRHLALADPSPQRPLRAPVGRNVRLNALQVAQMIAAYEAGPPSTNEPTGSTSGEQPSAAPSRRPAFNCACSRQLPLWSPRWLGSTKSGLSLTAASQCVHFDPTTVLRYLRLQGVTTRDCQGRQR
jgi:hypothetical protein